MLALEPWVPWVPWVLRLGGCRAGNGKTETAVSPAVIGKGWATFITWFTTYVGFHSHGGTPKMYGSQWKIPFKWMMTGTGSTPILPPYNKNNYGKTASRITGESTHFNHVQFHTLMGFQGGFRGASTRGLNGVEVNSEEKEARLASSVSSS